jgi:hypothetical protein
MKALLIFLILLPVVSVSQAKFDLETEIYDLQKRECEEQNKKDKAAYYKLKHEAAEMNFYALTRMIISDLDKTKFTRKYINLRYSSETYSCGVIDSENYECIREYNLKDPFYNRQSWGADDLIFLGKVFADKIIIPSRVGIGFGYSEGFYYVDEENSAVFRNLKKGKITETNREFYYYAKKNKSPLAVSENLIADELFFSFENLPDYRVKVTQYINYKKTVKTYEFGNGEWTVVE